MSACVDTREDVTARYRREASQVWWESERGRHELSVSAEVIYELSFPTYPTSGPALALTAGLKILPITPEVLSFAKLLVSEKVMPGPSGGGDAVHAALCAVHRVDVLLSWNQKHLANPRKAAHLRSVCMKVGYPAPLIVNPEALWPEDPL